MTNEEMILKSVQAHLTPAQRHEIAAAAYTPEQIAHAVEHIPDGLDALAASQVHTFAWWKDNGKSVKRGEKALFTCPLWKYTDKPSKAQIKAAEAAGKELQPAAHYYPTTSYMFSCLQVESSKPAPAGRFKSIDEIKAYNKMLAEQRRAARVSAAIKTAAEAIAQDVTTEARQAAQQAAARVVVAVEEHHELPELVEAPQPAAKKSSKATIKRVQARIAKIEAAKAAAPVEDERDGYTYKEDQESMRVQLIFPGKPDDETRDVLKHNGFHWSPRNGAWQRQLNDAGKYAAHRVMEFLDGNE